MVSLLTSEDAQGLTNPVHDLWIAAMRYAEAYYWDAFRKANPQMFAAFTATTRADMLRDAIIDHVRHDNSVMINDDAFGFPVQVIDSGGMCAIARFKLLDPTMQPQNHVSGQQADLDEHAFTTEQLSLAGVS